MDKDRERLKNALDSMIFLPHLKDRQTQNSLASLFSDSKTTSGVGRPWDKGDLFRRLQTFRASTWFAKPDAIGAGQCARHGWENTGVDMLTCEVSRRFALHARSTHIWDLFINIFSVQLIIPLLLRILYSLARHR